MRDLVSTLVFRAGGTITKDESPRVAENSDGGGVDFGETSLVQGRVVLRWHVYLNVSNYSRPEFASRRRCMYLWCK